MLRRKKTKKEKDEAERSRCVFGFRTDDIDKAFAKVCSCLPVAFHELAPQQPVDRTRILMLYVLRSSIICAINVIYDFC